MNLPSVIPGQSSDLSDLSSGLRFLSVEHIKNNEYHQGKQLVHLWSSLQVIRL